MLRIVYAGFSPAEVDAFERCPTRVLENLSKAEGVPLGKKGHADVAAAMERGTTIRDFARRASRVPKSARTCGLPFCGGLRYCVRL